MAGRLVTNCNNNHHYKTRIIFRPDGMIAPEIQKILDVILARGRQCANFVNARRANPRRIRYLVVGIARRDLTGVQFFRTATAVGRDGGNERCSASFSQTSGRRPHVR